MFGETGVLGVMAFVSVVILAVVTFIFISNTRQKVAELDANMKRNDQIIKNNLIGLNSVSNQNDKLLDQKYSSLFEVDDKDNEDSSDDVLKVKRGTEIRGSLKVCDIDGINCKNVTLTQ